ETQAAASRLTLAEAHRCQGETEERLAALWKKLDRERVVTATPVAEAQVVEQTRPKPSPRPARPSRPIMEILLDPRNIHWLLVFGAALLVLGLVIYLYTVGLFENAGFVAALMGVGTLGLLGGGWATIKFTRYQIAGRALTLLACLVMPLN